MLGSFLDDDSERLGDLIETALTRVGITEERVSIWIGAPCGCPERKERLNQLHGWAVRVIKGRVEKAKEYLNSILEG